MATAHGDTVKGSSGLKRFIPILAWLPEYDRSSLALDVVAGLTLWGLVVPEAMAYAGIAGMPPQAGLYTILAAYLVYAVLRDLTPSRGRRDIGDGRTARLVGGCRAGRVRRGERVGSQDVPGLRGGLRSRGRSGLLGGRAGQLGFVTQFLSKPVMDGFVVGLAVFVAVGQLYKLFGVEKPEGNTVEKLLGVLKELPQANWVTFAVGAGALLLLFGLPMLSKKLPSGLVVLFGAIGAQFGAGPQPELRRRGRRHAPAGATCVRHPAGAHPGPVGDGAARRSGCCWSRSARASAWPTSSPTSTATRWTPIRS